MANGVYYSFLDNIPMFAMFVYCIGLPLFRNLIKIQLLSLLARIKRKELISVGLQAVLYLQEKHSVAP